jgi:hypothetical protein
MLLIIALRLRNSRVGLVMSNISLCLSCREEAVRESPVLILKTTNRRFRDRRM